MIADDAISLDTPADHAAAIRVFRTAFLAAGGGLTIEVLSPKERDQQYPQGMPIKRLGPHPERQAAITLHPAAATEAGLERLLDALSHTDPTDMPSWQGYGDFQETWESAADHLWDLAEAGFRISEACRGGHGKNEL